MLIVILLFLVIASVALVVLKRDENSLLVLGLYASFILMLTGIIIYTAKIGGLNRQQEIFLFLFPSIKTWVQYQIITLDSLGYMIAVGRYLFPVFFLISALNYSNSPFVIRHRSFAFATLIIPAVSLVIYYPEIFFTVVRNRFELQSFIMQATLVWIMVYLFLALALLVWEYTHITMVYFRRQFRYIVFANISLAVLYGLYCFQDPLQVYQLYSSEYLWVSGLSYANPSMPIWGWYLLSFTTIIVSILGFWSLYHYTRINFQASQEDVLLKRKFDAASKGASVFVHSIKNQLLASRVVNKKINQLLAEETPDMEQLKKYTETLNQMNESMLERMEELYNSFKSKSITLVPVQLNDVLDMAVTRFHQKFPEESIPISRPESIMVLADKRHLSEAVYNLLVNAQESVLAANREDAGGRVEIFSSQERMYTVIEVRDNGTGISQSIQKKISDPFFTSKNTNYNWGMGLYYVRQIVKSHFGTLRFESTPGTGTSFYIMLPRYGGKVSYRRKRGVHNAG